MVRRIYLWCRQEVDKHPVRTLIAFALALVGFISGVLQILDAKDGGWYIIVGSLVVVVTYGWIWREALQARIITQLRADRDEAQGTTATVAHLSRLLHEWRLVARLAVQDDKIDYEEGIELICIVGADDAGDFVLQRHTTKTSAGSPLRWREVVMRGSNQDNQITDLESLKPQHGADIGEMRLLPLHEAPGDVRALAAFLTPITELPRKWWIRYQWPGLWRPLREEGVDQQVVRVSTTRTKSVTVTFEFPRGTRNPRFLAPPPEGILSSETSPGESPRLHFQLRNPAPGAYNVRVQVDEIGSGS